MSLIAKGLSNQVLNSTTPLNTGNAAWTLPVQRIVINADDMPTFPIVIPEQANHAYIELNATGAFTRTIAEGPFVEFDNDEDTLVLTGTGSFTRSEVVDDTPLSYSGTSPYTQNFPGPELSVAVATTLPEINITNGVAPTVDTNDVFGITGLNAAVTTRSTPTTTLAGNGGVSTISIIAGEYYDFRVRLIVRNNGAGGGLVMNTIANDPGLAVTTNSSSSRGSTRHSNFRETAVMLDYSDGVIPSNYAQAATAISVFRENTNNDIAGQAEIRTADNITLRRTVMQFRKVPNLGNNSVTQDILISGVATVNNTLTVFRASTTNIQQIANVSSSNSRHVSAGTTDANSPSLTGEGTGSIIALTNGSGRGLTIDGTFVADNTTATPALTNPVTITAPAIYEAAITNNGVASATVSTGTSTASQTLAAGDSSTPFPLGTTDDGSITGSWVEHTNWTASGTDMPVVAPTGTGITLTSTDTTPTSGGIPTDAFTDGQIELIAGRYYEFRLRYSRGGSVSPFVSVAGLEIVAPTVDPGLQIWTVRTRSGLVASGGFVPFGSDISEASNTTLTATTYNPGTQVTSVSGNRADAIVEFHLRGVATSTQTLTLALISTNPDTGVSNAQGNVSRTVTGNATAPAMYNYTVTNGSLSDIRVNGELVSQRDNMNTTMVGPFANATSVSGIFAANMIHDANMVGPIGATGVSVAVVAGDVTAINNSIAPPTANGLTENFSLTGLNVTRSSRTVGSTSSISWAVNSEQSRTFRTSGPITGVTSNSGTTRVNGVRIDQGGGSAANGATSVTIQNVQSSNRNQGRINFSTTTTVTDYDFVNATGRDLMIEGVSVPDQSAIPEDMRTSVRVSPSGNFDITSPGTFDVVVTNGSGGTILVDSTRVQNAATHIAADEQSGLVASDITFDLDIETAAVNADGSPGDTQTAPAFVDSMDNTLTRIVSTGYTGTFTQ